MNKIHVVGVSESLLELHSLPKDVLKDDRLIIATKKHHSALQRFSQRIGTISPLQNALAEIGLELIQDDVVVLASGDPLFYGIGATLLRQFPAEQIIFYPTVSSLQQACALFKTPWHDAHIISLHGRKSIHLPGILTQPKTIALTDQINSPNHIAREMINYLGLIGAEDLFNHITIMVAEDIGGEGENVFCGTLHETAQHTFSQLNVFCCLHKKHREHNVGNVVFGLHEDDIQHSRGLITKSEVRAASLHSLRLPKRGVFWDLGAGSGSLSIEAARMVPDLTIYAVEQKDEEMANIKANIRKFGCYNIIPLQGRAADIIKTLPTPDRIFVGGSGGELEQIIAHGSTILPKNGRILVNSVLEKTAIVAPQFMEEYGFTVTTSRISVQRNVRHDNEQLFNPITLIIGEK